MSASFMINKESKYKYKVTSSLSVTKNVLDYNRQLNKTEEASINKRAFKMFSPNLRKYIGMTTIP